MNDRHRTIRRYRMKHLKKGDVPYFLIEDWARSICPVIKKMTDGLINIAEKLFKAIYQFQEDIKAMPDEEFQKKYLDVKHKLTPEQIVFIEKIRGEKIDERPNNESESMGE